MPRPRCNKLTNFVQPTERVSVPRSLCGHHPRLGVETRAGREPAHKRELKAGLSVQMAAKGAIGRGAACRALFGRATSSPLHPCWVAASSAPTPILTLKFAPMGTRPYNSTLLAASLTLGIGPFSLA